MEARHLAERPRVGRGADDDAVDGGLHQRGVDLQPVGDAVLLVAHLPDVAHGAGRVGQLVVEDEVAVAPDPARGVEQERRGVDLRHSVPGLSPDDRDPPHRPGDRQVSPLVIFGTPSCRHATAPPAQGVLCRSGRSRVRGSASAVPLPLPVLARRR
jgi:hypothetical protein